MATLPECSECDRLRALARRLLNSQEDERRRLVRELHDEIGQALATVKITLQGLRGQSPLHDSVGIPLLGGSFL